MRGRSLIDSNEPWCALPIPLLTLRPLAGAAPPAGGTCMAALPRLQL